MLSPSLKAPRIGFVKATIWLVVLLSPTCCIVQAFQASSVTFAATPLSNRLSTTPSLHSTRLYHMGHSHSQHHLHHQEGRDANKIAAEKITQTTKWIRRLATWLCCWMATCGMTLMKHKSLTGTDWIAFGVSSVVISSANKVQRAFSKAVSRFQKLKEGVVKHSSFPMNNNIGKGNSENRNSDRLRTTTAQAVAAIQNTEEADRVTWMGVIINLVLSIGKLVVGIAQNSAVLIADAGHSLSDLVSDFITLWSVNVARLPPDDDHPYGHYKFEAIGSLFLSLTLLMTGVSVGLHSQKELLSILRSSGIIGAKETVAAAALTVPGPLALVMAALSILSKEWLFRVTKVVGEKLNSPVVIANAWHHRSDAYSSILALLSIAWAMAGFPAADAAAGMLVAGMIAMTGGDIMVESIKQLSDSAHEELQDEISHILKSLNDDDVLSITSIRARQVGSASVADVTVEISSDMTTTATRAVEERVQQHLRRQMSDGNNGRSVVVTVHAKPNLVICPLLNQHMYGQADSSGNKEALQTNAILDHSHDRSDPSLSSARDAAVTASAGLSPSSVNVPETGPSKSSSISASLIESQVRQQALLLYPQIHFTVTGVTVHFSSQNTVSVDCNIQVDQYNGGDEVAGGASSLLQVQKYADRLQDALETNLQEIESARIFLDLNHPSNIASMSKYA